MGRASHDEWSQAAPRKELTGRRRETQDERTRPPTSTLKPSEGARHCTHLGFGLGGSILFQATPSVAFVPAVLGDSSALWALVSSYACLVAQPCPTLCDARGSTLPSSSVHGISRQEYWSGLPCPPPGDLPDPGTKSSSLMSPALADGFFTTSATALTLVQCLAQMFPLSGAFSEMPALSCGWINGTSFTSLCT